MKVLFVNPPNIRSDTSTVENGFAVKAFIVPPFLGKFKLAQMLFRRLNKITGLGNSVRYGVRAGSRWPFTMDQPLSDYAPYPFFMGYAVMSTFVVFPSIITSSNCVINMGKPTSLGSWFYNS